jgi:hypothetical protein
LGLVEFKILRKETIGMTQKKMVQPATRRYQEKSEEPVIIINATSTKCTKLLYIIYN